ncbi:MAG: F0F1 ATP synthase subunit B [Clostridia bacterium]|nr:F0F1 ATP synthase subunit B [Clostridia bacterium]
MQSLDIISVNLWQILISLANLLILFVIIKKFLFKPVKQVMDQRQNEIDARYAAAEEAQSVADEHRKDWEDKLSTADAQADAILQSAAENAKYRGEKLISEAEARADGIIRAAQTEAELERKKATEGIKKEIVEVSEALTEKLLEREINTQDHRRLIDSFIEDIGDGND